MEKTLTMPQKMEWIKNLLGTELFKGTNMKDNLKEANDILGIKNDGYIADQLSTLLTELKFGM